MEVVGLYSSTYIVTFVCLKYEKGSLPAAFLFEGSLLSFTLPSSTPA